MLTTILLSALLGMALTVVLWVFIRWYNRNQDNPSGEVITDSMVRKMLKEKGCSVVDDNENPDWIQFMYDGKQFFIRVCGSYCEVHAGMFLEKSRFDTDITRNICNNEMRNITCGHMWYDEANSRLLVTAFSIHKTYKHLKISFYNMLQCVYYMFSTFDELYHQQAHGNDTNVNNKMYS